MPTVPLSTAFEMAVQLHREGNLAEAETTYRRILAVQPSHAESLQLLGAIVFDRGEREAGLLLVEQATALQSRNAAFHCQFSGMLRTAGRWEAAIAEARTALQLQPDFPEALSHLGNALTDAGRYPEAQGAIERLVALRPGYAGGHYNLGNVLSCQQRWPEAAAAYRRALEIEPKYAAALGNLGMALKNSGRFEEAIATLRRAIELDPSQVAAHCNLCSALSDAGQPAEAVTAGRKALALLPDFVAAKTNLGNALLNHDQAGEALPLLEAAVAAQPANAEAQNNLGSAWLENGRLDEAEAAYRRALELRPDFPIAKFNLAYLLLLRGDFARGLPLYESRWDVFRFAVRHFSEPDWTHASAPGQRVLIHVEQGLGDSIQFIRYAQAMAGRGDKVIMECPPSQAELFRTAAGVEAVTVKGEPMPPFEAQVAILSLPLAFQTTAASVPKNVPYLFADSARRAAWRERLGPRTGCPRIGLAWVGNTENPRLRKRHLTLAQLGPLLRLPEIEFHSLQLGPGAEKITTTPEATSLIDHTAHLRDFADTAALMMDLDLVISVDTAVAHLAGALGRPVWTLLPFMPDWRWQLGEETTPWYPTMRLFRQPGAGDWTSVITRVVEELPRWLSQQTAALGS